MEALRMLMRSISYGFTLDDRAQGTPLTVGQLLGVVQLLVVEVRGQDDRGCIDRPSQATATGFVAAGFHHIFYIIRL